MSNTNPNPSPSEKVEIVFASLVKTLAQRNFPSVEIRTGRPQDDEEDIPTPVIDVYAQRARIDPPDLEDEWQCELHIRITMSMDDNNSRDLEGCSRAIYNLLFPASAVKPLVNYPLPSRPVPDFWLVDIYLENPESTTEGRLYREKLSFCVKFRDDNGQG